MNTIKDNGFLADLHTHILPEIDDGPQTVEESIAILKEEAKQGITHIALTPHFSLSDVSVEEFLNQRELSFGKMMAEVDKNPDLAAIKFHLGAEVSYNPNLIYEDVAKLCIGDTSYILLELLGSYPFNIEKTVSWMVAQGITPIIAHAERYGYLMSNLSMLDSLIDAGAIIQCNAESVLSIFRFGRIKRLIRDGYVHLIASDTHNLDKRPPSLNDAYDKLKKLSDPLINNAERVIDNAFI